MMTVDETITRFERQLKAARTILDKGVGAHPGEINTAYLERVEQDAIALKALRFYQAHKAGSKAPLTRGDTIRAMSDQALAELFTAVMSRQRTAIINQLQAAGIAVNVGIIEVPALTTAAHLEWLREPVEEGRHE